MCSTFLCLTLITSALAANPLYKTGERVEFGGPGDIHVAGKTLEIRETVIGDVVAAGQSLRVLQGIGEDLWFAGESLILDQRVGDDLRALAARLYINQPVDGHVLVAGEEILVGPESTIGKKSMIAGGEITLEGTFKEPVTVFGKEVIVTRATFDDQLEIYAEEIFVDAETSIGKNLVVRTPSEKDATVLTKNIGGELFRKKLSKQDIDVFVTGRPMPLLRASPYLSQWILGLLLVVLWPKKMETFRDRVLKKKLTHLGLGVLVPIAWMLVAVILALPFTLLTVMMALALPVILFLSGILVPLLITPWTATLKGKKSKKKKRALWKETCIATVILYVLYSLLGPIGLLFSVVLSAMTLGAVVTSVKR